MPKISCLIPAYNEAHRISDTILSAVSWADQIIVINKSSTDNTANVAQSCSEKVKIINRAYSPKGDDNFLEYIEYPENDWIFILTCSEIPTRKLIHSIVRLLNKNEKNIDLVYIPRRMYSLGINQYGSPWYVSYYPFLFHRRRVKVQNTIHDNIRPTDSSRTVRIPYSEDCCVYHFTHPCVQDYIHSTLTYALIEAKQTPDELVSKKIIHSFKNIQKAATSIAQIKGDWIPAFSAWTIYWLITVLCLWEKTRTDNVSSFYKASRKTLLENEWTNPTLSQSYYYSSLQLPVSPSKFKLWQRFLVAILTIPYFISKISFIFARPFYKKNLSSS
ncbi:MAG: glycosyltransferase [Methylacidiphilales bacterium]|nr:glycosyltransferase [Candidatus Methylacidiphilales bacterium]MDW8348843.1 glycosyltransferase [Verrucomicrobiae bacterium]